MQVVSTFNHGNLEMIPKIAHQTAKTKQLHRREEKLHQKLKQMLHDWHVIIWDDDDNLRMVRKYFPTHVEMFNELPYGVMRADIARYMYMAVYGGFYFDTDYEVLRCIGDEFRRYRCVLPKSREPGDPDNPSDFIRLGNAVFGSEAGYPFWRDLLIAFFSDPNVGTVSNKQIETTSGPEFITRFYLRNAHQYQDIHLPDRAIFHPAVSRSPLADRTRSYGVHHCFGSWRENSLGIKAWRLFGRALRPIGLRTPRRQMLPEDHRT